MITIEVKGKEATFSRANEKWRGKDKDFIKQLNDNAPNPDEDYTAGIPWRIGLDGVTGIDGLWYESAIALYGKSVKIKSYKRDSTPEEKEDVVY